MGGEVPGAAVFTTEHLRFNYSGFALGMIFTALTLGNVLSSVFAYYLTIFFTENQMNLWGWRIPFISGFFLGIIAYILRRKTLETPIFLAALNSGELHRIPVVKLIQTNVSSLLRGISLTALPAATIFFFLYLPSYSPIQKFYQPHQIYFFNIMNFLSLAIFTAIFGYCSDYIDRKKLILIGIFASTILSFLFMKFIADHKWFLILGILLGASIALVNGCYVRIIVESFADALRFSGIGVAYNIGFAIFGGVAPIAITLLFKLTQNAFAPLIFLWISYFITLLGVIKLKNTSHMVLANT